MALFLFVKGKYYQVLAANNKGRQIMKDRIISTDAMVLEPDLLILCSRYFPTELITNLKEVNVSLN